MFRTPTERALVGAMIASLMVPLFVNAQPGPPVGHDSPPGAEPAPTPSGDQGPPPAPPTAPPEPIDPREIHAADTTRSVLPSLPYRGVQEATLALRNSRWYAVDSSIPLREIVFGSTTVASYFSNGESLLLWAEFAGNHPDCFGYPRCVVAVREDGSYETMFFGGDDTSLYSVDCVDWRRVGDGPEMPSNEALEANGVEVVWRNDPVVCLHMGRPLYQRVPQAR